MIASSFYVTYKYYTEYSQFEGEWNVGWARFNSESEAKRFISNISNSDHKDISDVLVPLVKPSPKEVEPSPIVTENICPPIPIRDYDWRAFVDGQEEEGPYGYGATEAEAIKELKAELDLAK